MTTAELPPTKRLHIAVDMDDVILDLCGGLQQSVRTEWGVGIPLVHFMDRDYQVSPGRKLFGPEMLGYYSDSESWLRDKAYVWATFPPIDGALGGLRSLRDAGHHVEIVTAKPEWAEWVTWKWLGRWKPPVHAVTIVPLGATKVDFTDADVLIDDSVANCSGFVSKGRRAVLFDRPWNRPPQNSGALRCNTWAGVVAHLNNDERAPGRCQ